MQFSTSFPRMMRWMMVPITAFSDDSKGIVNLASIREDFGVAFNSGDSAVNVCIDNVRFEKK